MQVVSVPGVLLEPLVEAHADELFALLSDPALYEHLDYGPPASVEHLRESYRRLEARRSPDGNQQWLNWLVRLPDGQPVGYVQATVLASGVTWVAYVLGAEHWGKGFARRATGAMVDHLKARYGSSRFLACVERGNARSARLLEALGFRAAMPSERAAHELAASEQLFVLGA